MAQSAIKLSGLPVHAPSRFENKEQPHTLLFIRWEKRSSSSSENEQR